MKILLVQDHLRSGGTERQTVLLANAFAAAGHDTTLITFRPRGAIASTLAPSVRHHALQRFDTGLDWFAPGFNAILQRFPSDIILCMGRMANCYAQVFVRKARDRWPELAVIGTLRTGKTLPWLFRRSLRAVHHIVANSRAAHTALVKIHALPAAKITVIPNSLVFPAATTATTGRNHPLRTAHGADARTTVMLDVAMFRPEKNQRELIAIAAGLPAGFPWQLWLAGDGPARAGCESFAAELGLAERVKFLGFQRAPAPLYAAADLAVHASRSESLSNFLIEAQAHGLPAVAYAAQGIDECFIPGDTGVSIPFGNHQAFLSAIRRFADRDPQRMQRARDFARRTFDPARQVQAYLDLFTNLLQR
jgi:glycosyltransferase involved in cell wall biosynthesis